MNEVAPGVWRMSGIIPCLINVYLIRTTRGEVLIDAGMRWMAGGLVRALRGRPLAMVALTHVHPDHQGAAHAICTRRCVPLACHEADADVMEGRRRVGPPTWLVSLADMAWSGPAHPVSVRWKGGESLGEWEVIHAPGHTAGHVIYFRRSDGVAVAGDVLRNASLRGGFGRLAHTPDAFNESPAGARQAVRILHGLRPSLLCLGHGPPSRDVDRLARLAG